MNAFARHAAVFFDLDGTLIDSAPDLAAAANDMRIARGRPPLPLSRYRPLVGRGARGMVAVAFADEVDGEREDEAALRSEFLGWYDRRLLETTALFPGVAELLDALRAADLPWGIVTNKAIRLATPICVTLGLTTHAVALVGGDSTPHAKPHPAPLLAAAERAGVDAGRCVYVGDDLRDVQAGHAAGMTTVAVGWGYLGDGPPIDRWEADRVVYSPAELSQALTSAPMP